MAKAERLWEIEDSRRKRLVAAALAGDLNGCAAAQADMRAAFP